MARRIGMPGLCAVVAVCLVLPALAATADPALEGLKLEVAAFRVAEALPVYVSFQDDPRAASLVTVPRSGYDVGLSSVVLFAAGENDLAGLQAARLTSPGGRLVVIDVTLRNASMAHRSLHVDDLVVQDARGGRLQPVAVAVGQSYLVAKTSPASRTKAGQAAIALPSLAESAISLAFAVPAASFPLVSALAPEAPIGYDTLPQWVLPGGPKPGELNAQGTVQAAALPLEKRDGSLQAKADVRFETVYELSATKIYAVEMNRYGGRGLERVPVTELLNGQTTTREVPVLARYGRGEFTAGRISFLKPVTRRELTAPGSVSGVEVRVSAGFEAKQGDALAAVGRADHFALSLRLLD